LVQKLGQVLVDEVTFYRPVVFGSRVILGARFSLKIVFKIGDVRSLNLEIMRNLSDFFAENTVTKRKVLDLDLKV
jgi:hypothetical protein